MSFRYELKLTTPHLRQSGRPAGNVLLASEGPIELPSHRSVPVLRLSVRYLHSMLTWCV